MRVKRVWLVGETRELMNDRNRRPPPRRTQQEGPRFCSTCGGMLTAQQGGNPGNVCRCKKKSEPKS